MRLTRVDCDVVSVKVQYSPIRVVCTVSVVGYMLLWYPIPNQWHKVTSSPCVFTVNRELMREIMSDLSPVPTTSRVDTLTEMTPMAPVPFSLFSSHAR